MKRYFWCGLAVLLVGWLVLSRPVSVQAVPPLPSSFYGTLKLNGANVPDGTVVQALIKGKVVAYNTSQTYQGGSVYALDIPGDDPGTAAVEGGVDGDPISFTIGGISAGQTGVWHSATNVNLDLSAASANTPELPQATVPPPPTQTAISIQPPAVATEDFVFPTVAPAANTAGQAGTPAAGQPAAAQPTASAAQPNAAAPASPPQAPQANTGAAAPGPAPTSGAASPSGSTQSTAALSPQAGTPAAPSSAGSLAWVVILAVVVVGGLAGYLYLRRKK